MTPPTLPTSWARRFLGLAQVVATWSKDPSTKVGAVIVDADRRIVSTGYNGFPAGVQDCASRYKDRDFKLPAVVHAEVNAILFAGRRLEGCVLVTTTFPCARCVGVILQAGIREVICPDTLSDERMQREPWKSDHTIARQMLWEASCSVLTTEFP